MAKTLQEILSPAAIAAISRYHIGPFVHRLIDLGGDPHMIGTACGYVSWERPPLDPNRVHTHIVTCKQCLLATADVDTPLIVEAPHD